MKKAAFLAALLVFFVLAAAACTPEPPQPTATAEPTAPQTVQTVQTAPPVTEPPATEPPATEPPDPTSATENPLGAVKPPEDTASELPILLTVETPQGNIDCFRMTWDMGNGCLSEGELYYRLKPEDQSYNEANVRRWTGGTTVYGIADTECADGVQYVRYKYFLRFGSCYTYDCDKNFYQEDRDGTIHTIPLPGSVPADVYPPDRLENLSPYYATMTGDTAVVVYRKYEILTDPETNAGTDHMDLIFCVYSPSAPENAVWHVTPVPTQYYLGIISTSLDCAYADGYLYIPSMYDILKIDVKTGSLSCVDGLEDIHALVPDSTIVSAGGQYAPIVLVGSQNGIIVENLLLYEPGGLVSHSFNIALQNGNIVGVMETTFAEPGIRFTFYDQDLHTLGVDETYTASRFYNLTFARDD